MITSNPFAALSASIPPAVIQIYVAVMILLVIGGTLLDIARKKSARYFFDNWQGVKARGRPIGGGEMVSLAIQTAAVDVLTSGEFCNTRRRIAHLLGDVWLRDLRRHDGDHGFRLPDARHPGAGHHPRAVVSRRIDDLRRRLLVLVRHARRRRLGRQPAVPFRVRPTSSSSRSSSAQPSPSCGPSPSGRVLLALYLIATTVLFGGIPWSKFAHMFFKPAAAFQKRVETANGTRRGLPAPADKPASFGSGRRPPQNY